MSDQEQKTPAEAVLDLAVYAPLGLVITVAETFPQLVRKGRSRLGPQIALARSVGQFAVRQGARQLRGMTGGGLPFPFSSLPSFANFPPFPFRPGAGRSPTGPHATDDGPAAGQANGAARPRAGNVDPRGGTAGAPGVRSGSAGTAPGGSGPSGTSGGYRTTSSPFGDRGSPAHDPSTDAHLAIPSYDSLSASQVLQRLAGLSRDEVEAVRAYEARTRGRRTVLARADQLLG